MNLITCAEDCEYQKEGYCKLCRRTPTITNTVNGCSYYKKKKLKEKNRNTM